MAMLQEVVRRELEPYPEPHPHLEQGERLDREAFHARYAAMPAGTRAELIDGKVHMPSPLHLRHSRMDKAVFRWLDVYEAQTPGVEFHANLSTLLGEESEVQPDFGLILARGSKLHADTTADGPLRGAPELVVEIASTTGSIDLHEKKALYERHGVREYLVILARQPGVLWFARRGDEFTPRERGGDGVFRSEVFPGLWLDPEALLRQDTRRVREVLEQGLATPEHAAFITSTHVPAALEAAPPAAESEHASS